LFISIICAKPIKYLQTKKVPQSLAILIVFITLTAVFIGFGEIIANSVSSFSQNATQYEKSLEDFGTTMITFVNDLGFNLSVDKVEDALQPSRVMTLTAGILGELGGFMGNGITIFFLSLFLLFELDEIDIKSKAILKNSSNSFQYFSVIGQSIRDYLSIKTLTSLMTGVLIWLALLFIGVDYAILWALIAFLLNFIPNVGSIIAAVPAVMFALIQLGIPGALGTTIVFVVVNLLIGNVVEPKLMGKGMGLSTFIVFISLMFWGFVLGTVGMFLSVPLTMAIKIMLQQNPRTRWIAIILGTEKDALEEINNNK
ncbi:MAG: AI-2E family transporter, partial [Eudoraea sp.]